MASTPVLLKIDSLDSNGQTIITRERKFDSKAKAKQYMRKHHALVVTYNQMKNGSTIRARKLRITLEVLEDK